MKAGLTGRLVTHTHVHTHVLASIIPAVLPMPGGWAEDWLDDYDYPCPPVYNGQDTEQRHI